jgi:hypothetical protein
MQIPTDYLAGADLEYEVELVKIHPPRPQSGGIIEIVVGLFYRPPMRYPWAYQATVVSD